MSAANLTTPQPKIITGRDWVIIGIRAVASITILLLLYYMLPVESQPHESVTLRLSLGVALFVVVLIAEVRAISRHDRPMVRAGIAMATVIPLFIVLFAWLYLTLSHSDPHAFRSVLTRTDALYFTVTIFSTVGFGDITPDTEVARLLTMIQMLADLGVITIVVRLLFGVASRQPPPVTTPEETGGPPV